MRPAALAVALLTGPCALLPSCTGDQGVKLDSEAEDSTPQDTGEPGDALRALDPATLPAAAAPCAEPVFGEVDYAVDGDTVHFYPEGDTRWISVRLIGLDTPEIAHNGDPADCYGPEAAAFTQDLLNGRPVWLTFDAVCEDYFGRTLAYVHTGTHESDFVNRHIVRSGYAWAFPFDDTDTFEAEFEADEAAAREAGLGLWSACAR
ncbi:MAG: thermonuclease family protein [Alphaproteobacteria bacterium]|nr:thermonuclease family protein [Alphaproteobacteria bacterium]MCB9796079.1 thermonuclease family protein [Alphaproteobacteria bacterium]